jgi:hypothetical protein
MIMIKIMVYRQWCSRGEVMSNLTYWFRDVSQEHQYREQRDEQYPWYVLISTFLYLIMFFIQAIYLPGLVYTILTRLIKET